MMRKEGPRRVCELKLLQKYGASNVPRYTSYPTAPHFSNQVSADDYKQWLGELSPSDALSLYLHVPFCEELCWYCGCAAQVARKYGPVSEYARVMEREIETVSHYLAKPGPVRHLHWGGGSPNRLNASDFFSLMSLLRRHFEFSDDAELAIEIDPRTLDDSQIDAYARSGINRASLGLQDFTPKVQASINRLQPFELVADRVSALRHAGVSNLNFDLMYGLPYQTTDDAEKSVSLALSLEPSRIAVFGYAHVPWMRKHQKLIPETALPGTARRREQAHAMSECIRAAGYVQIGLDHFARPDDSMARAAAAGTLRRNFQGYTTDDAVALIGFGVSSIGYLPNGYIQNVPDTRLYEQSVRESGLAVSRGLSLTQDDRLRRTLIEKLMCNDTVDVAETCADYAIPVEDVLSDADSLGEMERDGLLTWDGSRIEITPEGRPYVRVVAALFDAFLASGKARHSGAV
ncbi:oxygen-independent coproporphyrinogen III oxidase [Nisaea acidiphila]|uniref:Coproporphyrinogen-III oxidase n=1 Tax=Nisaea acidiphila TaxID=1862145 RepID=A0A9J7ARS0_9PROT|nr:oxygen-independent coproporphyrinogen III oxidase [Nisaea acidiphila]UUX50315.1 oxygen-independent coproporphyrinogen III oxidase [Nisaea acidiphila]